MTRVNGFEVARRLITARVRWQHPLYLVHALTARCNARCGFCAWNPDFYDPRDQLPTDRIEQMYSDARSAGFIGLSMWGGEPLLHRDFARIAAHAHRLGLTTNMVTNGFLLERKMAAVVEHVDRVCISVDHPSAEHDRIRGIPGLFDTIVRATKELQEQAPKKPIVFICTLQRANVDRETIGAMADLISRLGVVGVFNALREEAASTEGVDLSKFAPSQAQLGEAFAYIAELKRRGHPILNSHTHLEMMAKGPPVYRCHWPKLMLPVEANGDVVDCMHWGVRPIGNVKSTPLAELLESPRLRELAGPAGEACHKCVSLHRVEISEVWDGNLEPLLSWRMLA
ncbi:MAG: radical SAM protein [Polyangiales bacterium]